MGRLNDELIRINRGMAKIADKYFGEGEKMPRLIDKDKLLTDNTWAFYDENGNRNDACIAVENAPSVDMEEIITSHEEIGYERGLRDGYAQAVTDVEIGESKSYTVTNNGTALSTARNLYYEQLQEQSDSHWAMDSVPLKHGQWKQSKYYKNIIFCDECGEPFELSNSIEHWNYCPNCGSKMDGERREDETD